MIYFSICFDRDIVIGDTAYAFQCARLMLKYSFCVPIERIQDM